MDNSGSVRGNAVVANGTRSGGLALERMFRARSIALVGATERSAWSNLAYGNFAALGFEGRLHLINRRGAVVYGKSAATSCAAVGEPIDAALLMVPVEALQEAFMDLRAAGVPYAVLLAAGFAEAGGVDRQTELLDCARGAGLTLLGPNCLGFVNFVDRVPLWTTRIQAPTRPGSIALVSQSGATASYIASFASQFGIEFSHMVSTGNEADLNAARIVQYLVDDPRVKAIALFLETVRARDVFTEAAGAARRANKPILVFKVGTSPAAAKTAQAHTASLVGDDRVFDAACRRLGIIRVSSIEDLVFTAQMLVSTGPIRRRTLAAVAISGGVCEIAADRAAAEGVELAALTPATQDKLRAVLPEFGTAANPLDLTGAAVLNPTLIDACVSALAADPEVGLVACFTDVAAGGQSPVERQMLTHIGTGLAGSTTPAIVLSVTPRTVDASVHEQVDATNLAYLPSGVQHGLAAIGATLRWSAWLDSAPSLPARAGIPHKLRPESERQALEYLAEHGLPVIPAIVAQTAQQALDAAARFGGPVVMKVASPDIAHKSDIGCVRLGIEGRDAIDAAFLGILENARRFSPAARIDGVIVSPQRAGTLEIFIGTLCDPQWGPVISVGLGGIWVEVLNDTSVRLLPVDETEALSMLDGLRGARLLDGYRGAPAVDREAIARAIVQIGTAALALGPELQSLEVNPLLVGPAGVEALDALVVWASA